MRLFRTLPVLCLASVLAAAGEIHLRPPLWVDRDDHHIPEPKEHKVSELYAIVYNSWLRHLSPERHASGAGARGAMNVNAWDEVPDSSWFTNRIGRRSLSFDEIVNGLEGSPPEPGPWTILRVKDEGYTPGLDVGDAAGRKYVVKFDLPSILERNSAAERICTLILHAAGYNVPHNSIAYLRREQVVLTEASYYRDAVGNRRKLTEADLEDALQKLKALPDGRYRGLASHFLPKPVGKFVYAGRREDDPNDLVPHELRRELRGLRVIASWINHVDVGDKNTIDCYVSSGDGRMFIRHYLLDFGSTMGSGDFFNGPYRVGHEYLFDGPAIGRAFLTLGIWRRPWDVHGKIWYPEVGYYQAELFEPGKWKPNYPNLAFERMDKGDAYWGAKIVTAFSDETIRRLAEAGEYGRDEVTAHVAEVLKQRRDAIGRHWLDLITPLEEFTLDRSGGEDRLRFRDLAVERGYAEAKSRSYRFRAEGARGKKLLTAEAGQAVKAHLPLRDLLASVARAENGPPDRYGRTPVLRILVQSDRRSGGWAMPVEVVLGYNQDRSGIEVLGWRHAVRQ